MRYKLGVLVLIVLICILCFYSIRMIQEDDRMKKSNTGVQEEFLIHMLICIEKHQRLIVDRIQLQM